MKFRLFLIIVLILAVFSISVYAKDRVDLSYKILESRREGNLLLLKVKLKVKNLSSEPIYNVIVKLKSSNSVNIDKNEIYIGKIDSYNTRLSDDIFNITISIPLNQEEKPQAYIDWLIEYKDINGNIIAESIKL